jgi:hypothetical protein
MRHANHSWKEHRAAQIQAGTKPKIEAGAVIARSS